MRVALMVETEWPSIAELLPKCSGEADPTVMRLAERLSMRRIFDEHEVHYRTVAAAMSELARNPRSSHA